MVTNGTKISALNETMVANNDDYVIINQGGATKKVKVKVIKGVDNVRNKYVELESD